MFKSTTEVIDCLGEQDYIATNEIGTVLFLAERLNKPVLAEGPAGVGKTELAKAWSAASGRELIRLQCYEGLDETKALYEWEYAKQMLYTQL
ncbi:MAG: AAA family ATPase, partial [Chloroflexi bacterium]|nr:AAA family ATPase [Chloroflexota bacterium]